MGKSPKNESSHCKQLFLLLMMTTMMMMMMMMMMIMIVVVLLLGADVALVVVGAYLLAAPSHCSIPQKMVSRRKAPPG